MRKEVIKYVGFNEYVSWYTKDNEPFNGKGSKCMFRVNHLNHEVEMVVLDAAPCVWNVIQFCFLDRDIRKELLWAMNKWERKNTLAYSVKVGTSGCKDVQFYYMKGYNGGAWIFENYKARNVILDLHISCISKLNEVRHVRLFSGDLLDILNVFIENIYDKEENCENGNGIFSWFEFLHNSKAYTRKCFRKTFKYLKFNRPKKSERPHFIYHFADFSNYECKEEYECKEGLE